MTAKAMIYDLHLFLYTSHNCNSGTDHSQDRNVLSLYIAKKKFTLIGSDPFI